MTQPEPNSLILPVEVEFVANEGKFVGPAAVYTPETWGERVAALRPLLTRSGEPFCPISWETIPSERRLKEEHVVPQGFGVKWVRLPPGFVDDRVNNVLSDCELDLMRTGTTGFLRPMYANGNKSATFSSGDRSVEVAHHHDRGFEIHLRGDGGEPPPGRPDELGPGEIRVTVPVPQARPELTSRALSKAAYLALLVHAPELALGAEFTPLRRWLLEREPGDARRYGEKLIPGAAPGASFRYLIGCDADVGRSEVTAVRWVVAHVRLHAVGYYVALVNESPDFDAVLKQDLDIQWFDDPAFHGRKRLTTFTFGFSAARRRGPDSA